MTRRPDRLPRPRPPARIFRLALLVAWIAAACTGGSGATGSQAAISPAPPPNPPVVGVVVRVESTGLDKVTGFTLRTVDGELLTFRIGVLETGAEFPPGHLTEHQATSQPVRVTFTRDGEALVATRIEDAGG